MEPLPCPYAACGRCFTTSYNRKKHVEACHLKLRPYTCPLCSKTFPYKHSLNYHLKLHGRQERAGRDIELTESIQALGRLMWGLEDRDASSAGLKGGVGKSTDQMTDGDTRL